MSADDQSGPGQREVAYRLFAAEYQDAELSYSESEEERAPNYVITPTGARVNRLFVSGVLTEVERVNEDMLRARIVDPTGPFVAYAGQYQPEALSFFERTDPPAFLALTGKARTYQPEDSDRVFTSIRPESVNVVDAETRDRWVVETARATLRRVAIFADALEMDARGDDLEAALRDRGVDDALATGIPLAIDHYDTTTAYLESVRQLATDALEVVADEREEVRSMERSPGDFADVELGPLPEAELGETESSAEPASEAETESETAEPTEETTVEAETETSESTVEPEESATETPEAAAESSEETAAEEAESETEASGEFDTSETLASEPETEAGLESEAEPELETETETGGLGDFEPGGESADAAEGTEATESAETTESTDLYELDETERQEVEEEFGVEFETGTSVGEPGEAGIETPESEELDESIEQESEEPTADESVEELEAEVESEITEERVEAAEESGVVEEPEPEGEPETAETEESETPEESESAESEETAEEAAEPAEEVDLESVAVDVMRDLADGDGADREEVIAAVVDEYGVPPEDVEDAIQEALMNGQCYEPTDGTLKAI